MKIKEVSLNGQKKYIFLWKRKITYYKIMNFKLHIMNFKWSSREFLDKGSVNIMDFWE